MMSSVYPSLERFSQSIGISSERLVRAFEIEKIFHEKILLETDEKKRRDLYRDVYSTVHKIYGKSEDNSRKINFESKRKIVSLFSKELKDKSILDIGCGDGAFLINVENSLSTKNLAGIDISKVVLPHQQSKIQFIESDIIDFSIKEKFDVVVSDNVFEHIAPQDISKHIDSIKNVLEKNGTLIIMMPNRLFGPSDVTRIIDFSYTNKTQATGTHVNESTYYESMSILRKNGFRNFRTVFPFPVFRYYLKSFRINALWVENIEQSEIIRKLLYALKYQSRCIFKLDVVIICNI